jgi:thiol:disulfide interchange protein DsbD
MEKEIFSQPDVQAQLADALWLKLDVTDNRAEHIAFMQKHAIFGPPTILFFRQNQEVQPGRLVGETDKDGFLAHLRRHQL